MNAEFGIQMRGGLYLEMQIAKFPVNVTRCRFPTEIQRGVF
jgi:hypothetical protein